MIPKRFTNRGTWAWHAATATQAAAIVGIWGSARHGFTWDHLVTVMACSFVFWGTVSWKSTRRQLHRAQAQLKFTQDNAAWLVNQLSEAHDQVRELSRAPRPQALASLTVQAPRIWGAPAVEEDWVFVPLLVQADSPHDPASTATGLMLPPGVPWHTPS